MIYSFILNAFFAGIPIALACSMLGIFLILKKSAFIGEGLAHLSFGGIALGLIFNINTLVSSLFFTLLGAFGITTLIKKSGLHDTSIGLVSYSGFALGILLISAFGRFSSDLLGYLFGNILLINQTEVFISIILSIIVIAFILFFINELSFISFDQETAKASGIKVDLLLYMLYLITAVTVVVSIRVVGLILVSSFIIMPAATSLRLAKSFRNSLFLSAIIGILSLVSGILISYYFNLAAGATIVLVNFAIYCLSYLKLFNPST